MQGKLGGLNPSYLLIFQVQQGPFPYSFLAPQRERYLLLRMRTQGVGHIQISIVEICISSFHLLAVGVCAHLPSGRQYSQEVCAPE